MGSSVECCGMVPSGDGVAGVTTLGEGVDGWRPSR